MGYNRAKQKKNEKTITSFDYYGHLNYGVFLLL